MLLQPLQWVWATVHITADAAHAVVIHQHTENLVSPQETLEDCNLVGAATETHVCHDNHTCHTNALGLTADIESFAHPSAGHQTKRGDAAQFDSVWLTTIERPRWIATL